MTESVNSLPVQTYVRSRASTIVEDVAGDSSGSIALNLDKPSDLTLIVISDPIEGTPTFFAAAIGRIPTMSDFDIIVSPTTTDLVKPAHKVTLRVPAMQGNLYWKCFDAAAIEQAFGVSSLSRLIVAIDQ